MPNFCFNRTVVSEYIKILDKSIGKINKEMFKNRIIKENLENTNIKNNYNKEKESIEKEMDKGDMLPGFIKQFSSRSVQDPGFEESSDSNHQNENKLYAFMTTIPSRKEILKDVIASIKNQVDKLYIYLNYPKEEAIPEFLFQDWINIVHAEINGKGNLYGDGKFYFMDKIKNGYIFTVDDDIIYGENYIKMLKGKIDQYDRKCIIGTHGGILPERVESYYNERLNSGHHHFLTETKEDIYVNILGTGVIGFHRSTINFSITDIKTRNSSDLWFAIICQLQKIPMVSIKKPEGLCKAIRFKESSLWSNRIKFEKYENFLAGKIKWEVFKI